MERLPLFPLRVVLLPQNTLPLHVFEDRYRLMVNRCIETNAPFGVALIRAGEEVGGWAEPYEVGTTARVSRVQRLPDGRMNLLVFGERRYRIVSTDRTEPYLIGDIQLLDSEDASTPEAFAAAERVSSLFDEHFRLVMAMTDQWVRRVVLPRDPGRLADFVAGHIDVPAEEKQALLEELSVPERLERVAGLLRGCIDRLSNRWRQKQHRKFEGAVLN